MADTEEEVDEILADAIEDNEQAEENKEEVSQQGEETIAEDDGSDDVDPFELLDEDTEDNEEQERMYREYIDLTKQIDCQNDIINDLKAHIDELRECPCPTRATITECQRLRICLDQENIKLNSMMNRAMQLQNDGSQRLYTDIELATTGYEANMFGMSTGCTNTIKFPSRKKGALTADEICDACLNPDNSDSDDCS